MMKMKINNLKTRKKRRPNKTKNLKAATAKTRETMVDVDGIQDIKEVLVPKLSTCLQR